MKISNRIIYTSLLIVGCTLFAWPNTTGFVCDGQQAARATFFIQGDKEEEEPSTESTEDIVPLRNLFPACNLIFN